MSTINQQKEMLSKIASKEIIDFHNFFENHDNFKLDKPYGTMRDGSLLAYSVDLPLVGNSISVKLKILEPYWKHFFEVTLLDVISVNYGQYLLGIPNINEVKLLTRNNQKTLTMSSFYHNVPPVSITFKEGALIRYTLAETLDRDILIDET